MTSNTKVRRCRGECGAVRPIRAFPSGSGLVCTPCLDGRHDARLEAQRVREAAAQAYANRVVEQARQDFGLP